MILEKSCGAVVFTKIDNVIKYVIIKSSEGFYGFPKGHIENNETEIETAFREIYEETGLKVVFIDGFKTTDQHPIPNKPNVIKHITYFLATYDNQTINYQKEELSDAELMTYEQAQSAFQFESTKRILKEANDFLLLKGN